MYDGTIQHKILRIHQIRYTGHLIMYDLMEYIRCLHHHPGRFSSYFYPESGPALKKERCHEPYYAHNTAVSSTYSVVPQLFLILPFILVLLIYIHAVCISNRHQKKWPFYRSLLWFLGVFLAMTAVAGPLGSRAHMDFSFHMISRLLLGMLAPLLMAAAAPIALLLCTLNTALARRLSLILRSWPLRIITHPIVTSLLNVGGLWVLYKTRLYSLTNESMLIHIFEWDLFLSNKCPQHIKPTKYTFCGFFL